MEYTDTTLWRTSLANHGDAHDHLRRSLREAFERSRNNAKEILDKIRIDFPALTVHDITHVDSLWQVGSVIAGPEYGLNPLEGYVLGCAFLMHDAVLSFEAAGGQDALRKTVEWRDFYVDYQKDSSLSPNQQCYETDFRTIRLLHAKYAENLYDTRFLRADGSTFYIIEDESLRTHLGALICKIAASHHWSIDEVEKLGIQQAAPASYPRDWRINPMKLACIMRCADAGHIDAKRAPDYLLKLLTVNGVSRDHWIAQNRLSQIDTDMEDGERVIITSDIDFKESDFAAWNVAWDAVQVLDHEIKASNELLREHRIDEFQAKRVCGAESRQNLSRYIKTDGWMPCDASIHISNVEGLIKNLGGEKLYGKEYHLEIVLRELIQNARDAIVARRKKEAIFEGKISIYIEQIDGHTWVRVTDNGVGMSMQTIKDYFLNFGSSFWASDLAKSEYPGLNASGFKSVGRFGIGFYAIFMIASEVIVETRKYDKGLDSSIRIKFPSGMCLRPIIAKTNGESMDISTSVRFKIDEQKLKWTNNFEVKTNLLGYKSFHVPYASALSYLTAGLDVDVYYSELGEVARKIHTNIGSPDFDKKQWLKDITFAEQRSDRKYADYIDNNYERLRKVCYNGECYGLAALSTIYDDEFTCFDIKTIGGLANFSAHSGHSEYIGCLSAEPATAKRDIAITNDCKTDWVKEQYDILCQQGLTENDKLYLPYVVGHYGIDMTELIQVRVISHSLRIQTLSLHNLLLQLKEYSWKLILPLSSWSENRLENQLDYSRTMQMLTSEEVLFIVEKNSGFLSVIDPDSACQFNIMRCINVVAGKYNLNISKTIQADKAVSRLGGKIKVLVLTVLP